MIVGIGCDVVEVARIASAMENPSFTERILTQRERERIEAIAPHRLAGRWAAKEAAAKALAAFGGSTLGWHDLEVFNDDDGVPSITFVDESRCPEGIELMVSISHERDIAAAFVIAQSTKTS